MHELHLRAVRQTCSECYSEEQIDGWLRKRTPEGYFERINKNRMYTSFPK